MLPFYAGNLNLTKERGSTEPPQAKIFFHTQAGRNLAQVYLTTLGLSTTGTGGVENSLIKPFLIIRLDNNPKLAKGFEEVVWRLYQPGNLSGPSEISPQEAFRQKLLAVQETAFVLAEQHSAHVNATGSLELRDLIKEMKFSRGSGSESFRGDIGSTSAYGLCTVAGTGIVALNAQREIREKVRLAFVGMGFEGVRYSTSASTPNVLVLPTNDVNRQKLSVLQCKVNGAPLNNAEFLDMMTFWKLAIADGKRATYKNVVEIVVNENRLSIGQPALAATEKANIAHDLATFGGDNAIGNPAKTLFAVVTKYSAAPARSRAFVDPHPTMPHRHSFPDEDLTLAKGTYPPDSPFNPAASVIIPPRKSPVPPVPPPAPPQSPAAPAAKKDLKTEEVVVNYKGVSVDLIVHETAEGAYIEVMRFGREDRTAAVGYTVAGPLGVENPVQAKAVLDALAGVFGSSSSGKLEKRDDTSVTVTGEYDKILDRVLRYAGQEYERTRISIGLVNVLKEFAIGAGLVAAGNDQVVPPIDSFQIRNGEGKIRVRPSNTEQAAALDGELVIVCQPGQAGRVKANMESAIEGAASPLTISNAGPNELAVPLNQFLPFVLAEQKIGAVKAADDARVGRVAGEVAKGPIAAAVAAVGLPMPGVAGALLAKVALMIPGATKVAKLVVGNAADNVGQTAFLVATWNHAEINLRQQLGIK